MKTFKTEAQMKRMTNDALMNYAFEEFGIEDYEFDGLIKKDIISRIKDAIQIAEEPQSTNESRMISAMNKMEEKTIIKPGGDAMSKFKLLTNFLINKSDAKLKMGSLKKAVPAQEAVPAVKAVKEKKDKDGNITQEAAAAVKAIPAKEAVPAVQTVFLISKTEEIGQQVYARMADQGFNAENDGQFEMMDGGFGLRYKAENDKVIREAFKKVKDLAEDSYNGEAVKEFRAEQKKKKAAEAKAKAEAEEKTADDKNKGNVKSGKTEEEAVKQSIADKVEETSQDSENEEWPS